MPVTTSNAGRAASARSRPTKATRPDDVSISIWSIGAPPGRFSSVRAARRHLREEAG
jgi:hypothetical protein